MKTVRSKKLKPGRPPKAVKKEIRACIRYSKAEWFVIREKASKASLIASAYIREVTINGQVKPRLTDTEREFSRQLIGMANNLNQMAKVSHTQGIIRAMIYFENYRSELDQILQKLKT